MFSRLYVIQALLRKATLGFSCALFFFIMLLGGVDAISLNLFNQPVPSMLEISENLLAVAAFLALAGASDQHIKVDLIVNRLSGRTRRVLAWFSTLVCLFVFALIAWRMWGLALDSYAIGEKAIALFRFPIWPGKLLAAFGVSVAAAQYFFELLVQSGRNHIQA